MPSYRIALDILGTRAGVRPEAVLPAAEEILSRSHRVEDRSVELVGRQPQIHLRFGVEPTHDRAEDNEAEAAVRRLVSELETVASTGDWVLKRGPGGHWRPIRHR